MMTQGQLETVYHCRVLSWAEPTDNGMEFRAITREGQLIVADTVALLILAFIGESLDYLWAA